MFLTTPSTVASAERRFSKLKLIKNYLSSIMGQHHLKNLFKLSNESDVAKGADMTPRKNHALACVLFFGKAIISLF